MVASRVLGETLRQLRVVQPSVRCLCPPATHQRLADFLAAFGAVSQQLQGVQEVQRATGAGIPLYVSGCLSGSQVDLLNEIARIRSQQAAGDRGLFTLDPENLTSDAEHSEHLQYLLENGCPSIVKGSASEILALWDLLHADGKAERSQTSVEEVIEVASQIARTYRTVVVASGKTDIIADGNRVATVALDCKQLTRIKGVGTALGGMCSAASAAVSPADPFRGAVTAVATLKWAAKEAAKDSKGPGTLSIAIVDSLFRLSLAPDSLADEFVSVQNGTLASTTSGGGVGQCTDMPAVKEESEAEAEVENVEKNVEALDSTAVEVDTTDSGAKSP